MDNGVHTFTNGVQLKSTSGGCYVRVSDGSHTGQQSNIAVTPGALDHFKVTGSAAMIAGATNELTVTAYDLYDNIATYYSGQQSLIFSGLNPAPNGRLPTVEGTPTGSSINITFSNGASNSGAATLRAYKAETAAVNVTDGTVSSFGDPNYGLDLTISPNVTESLYFSQQPTDISANHVFSTDITVQLRDAYDNIRTNDNSTHVSIVIDNNPSGGTLTGTVLRTVADGVATFDDLSIDIAGSGYTMRSMMSGVPNPSVISNTFNITTPPTPPTPGSGSGAAFLYRPGWEASLLPHEFPNNPLGLVVTPEGAVITMTAPAAVPGLPALPAPIPATQPVEKRLEISFAGTYCQAMAEEVVSPGAFTGVTTYISMPEIAIFTSADCLFATAPVMPPSAFGGAASFIGLSVERFGGVSSDVSSSGIVTPGIFSNVNASIRISAVPSAKEEYRA
jgi:hypothetical protein